MNDSNNENGSVESSVESSVFDAPISLGDDRDDSMARRLVAMVDLVTRRCGCPINARAKSELYRTVVGPNG